MYLGLPAIALPDFDRGVLGAETIERQRTRSVTCNVVDPVTAIDDVAVASVPDTTTVSLRPRHDRVRCRRHRFSVSLPSATAELVVAGAAVSVSLRKAADSVVAGPAVTVVCLMVTTVAP